MGRDRKRGRGMKGREGRRMEREGGGRGEGRKGERQRREGRGHGEGVRMTGGEVGQCWK